MVHRQDCCQRPRNRGLGMPDLENHRFAERLVYLGRILSRDTVWGRQVSNVFPRLKSDSKVEGRRNPRGEAPFFCESRKAFRNLSGSSNLSRSGKEL